MAWLWRWVFVVGVPLALLVVLIGSWIERRSGKLYIVNVLPAPVAVSLDGRSISLGTAGQSGPVETAIGTHLLEVRSKEGVLLESEAVVVQGSPIITIYSVAGAAPISSARGGTGWCGQRILEVNNPKGLLQNAGAGAQARVVTAGGGLGTCVEWAENKGSPGLVMSLLLTAQRFSSLEAALPGVKSDDAWVFVFEGLLAAAKAKPTRASGEAIAPADERQRAQLHMVAISSGQLERARPQFQAWAEAADHSAADVVRYAALLPRDERLALLLRASAEGPDDLISLALARLYADPAKSQEALARLSPAAQEQGPARTLRWRNAIRLGLLSETYPALEAGFTAHRPELLDDALLYLGAAQRVGAKAQRTLLKAEQRAALAVLFPAPGEAHKSMAGLNVKQTSAFRSFELAALKQPDLALQQASQLPKVSLALIPSPLRLAVLLEGWRRGLTADSPLALGMGPGLRAELLAFLRTGTSGPVMDDRLTDQQLAVLWLVRARYLEMQGAPAVPAKTRIKGSGPAIGGPAGAIASLKAFDTDGIATRLLEGWPPVSSEPSAISASIERR